MKFLADENIEGPIIRALKEVNFDFAWVGDISPGAQDKDVLQLALANKAILWTIDRGIPSQTYLYKYAEAGVTVVVLRWKRRRADGRDFQEMLHAILHYADEWLQLSQQAPGIISVSRSRSRYRPWGTVPPSISQGT